MNDPTTPLSADLVDELLSAELDGDFDDAARDAGLSPVEARARLDVTPGVAERREDLDRARALATAEVAPLADDVRARLIARAVDAASSDELSERRGRRRVVWARSVGAVAAAALLVVGAVAVLSPDDRNVDDMSASAPTAEEDATADAAPGAGGDDAGGDDAARSAEPTVTGFVAFDAIDDADALRVEVEKRLASPEDFAAQSGTVETATTGAANATDEAAPPADGATCAAQQALTYGVTPVPLLQGPTTYAGVPASVFVFDQGDSYLIVVADDAGCRMLVTQFLHPEP